MVGIISVAVQGLQDEKSKSNTFINMNISSCLYQCYHTGGTKQLFSVKYLDLFGEANIA